VPFIHDPAVQVIVVGVGVTDLQVVSAIQRVLLAQPTGFTLLVCCLSVFPHVPAPHEPFIQVPKLQVAVLHEESVTHLVVEAHPEGITLLVWSLSVLPQVPPPQVLFVQEPVLQVGGAVGVRVGGGGVILVQAVSATHRVLVVQPAGLTVRVCCLCPVVQLPPPQAPLTHAPAEQTGGGAVAPTPGVGVAQTLI
jgi:hypothetical protein